MSRISFLVIFCASLIFRLGGNYDSESYDSKINSNASISESHTTSKNSTLFFESLEEAEYEEEDDTQRYFNTSFLEGYLETNIRLQPSSSCKSVNHSLVKLDKRPIYILYDHLLI